MKSWNFVPAILISALAAALTGCGTTGAGDVTGVPVEGVKYPIISPPPIRIPSDSSSPSNTQAVGGANQMTVSWWPVADALSYTIYWSMAAGISKDGNVVTGVASPFVHSGLAAGTTYYYIVVPVFAGGEGLSSAEFSGTTSP